MNRWIAISLVVLVSGSGLAQETKQTRAAAEKLLNLFNMDETYDQMMKQAMQMPLTMIESQDLADAEKAEAKQAVEASMKVTLARFSWDKMKGMFEDIYAEVLTEEELNGLIAFYESPIGKSFLKKQPLLTSATMQKMQGLMQDLMPAIQKEVAKVLEDAESEDSESGAAGEE